MKTTNPTTLSLASIRQNAMWLALTLLLGSSFSLRADVTSFTLMDANSDNPIGVIANGDTIDLDIVGPEIGIRADVSASVGSVSMDLSGPETINRVDNTSPYSLNGDGSGDFFEWTPAQGNYTLVGTSWQYGGATGTPGTPYTLTFVVVGDGSVTPPPPPPGGSGEFVEIGSLVVIEAESEGVYGDWDENTSNSGFTGASYIEWKTGNFSTGIDPAGSDPITYEVLISNPGRYKLILRSAAPNATEWNDVWARFPDNGALKEKGGNYTNIGTGWFKIYQNQSGDNWTYETKHVDFDPHDIYTDFNSPGVYRFQFSGRSTRFKVDRLVMYNESVVSSSVATNPSTPESPRNTPPDPCPVPANPSVSIALPTTATFSWDAVSEADGYGLEGRLPGSSSWQVRLTASTSRTISVLKPGFSYEWRVRSLCDGGAVASEYTTIEGFTMPFVREGISAEAAWTFSPNPANSMVRLDAVQSGWMAEAYSADGRLAKQWMLTGTNSILNLDGLNQGLYLLRVSDAQGMPQGSQRLLIQY